MKIRKHESGQVIVLMVFAMVGLLGITALAIDGGMLYSDRRHAQNAVDTGALAVAGEVGKYFSDHNILSSEWSSKWLSHCVGSEELYENLAINTALSNDPELVNVNAILDCGDSINKLVTVEVTADRFTPTSLTHMVFGDKLKNTVYADTSVKPRTPYATGLSIVSLTQNCGNANDRGTVISGDADVNVIGGGIWSNSCIFINGNNANLEAGSITYTSPGYLSNSSDNPISGEIIESDKPIEIEFDQPDCNGLPNHGSHTGEGTITYGNYNNIRVTSVNHDLVMDPGLYCVTGEITFNGGNLTGEGVTIVLLGSGPETLSITGNGAVRLYAPGANCQVEDTGCIPVGNRAVGGLLVWREANTSPDRIKLVGGSGSEFVGTVYAPNSTITVSGDASLENPPTYATQLIGNTIKIDGGGTVNIIYNESFFAHDYTKLNLER